MKISRSICSVAAAATFSTLALPMTAAADSVPSYAANGGETIHGRIASVPGKYDIYVRDDRGYVDHVVLHDGTVINPTGLTLAAGDTVTIMGGNQGSVFRADEVDTPYAEAPQSNDYDGAGDVDAGFPVGYGSPYGYGYGYPGFGGLYFGGGYYGGGYYRGGYPGRGAHRGGSDNRGSDGRGGHAGGSSRFSAPSGHFGSSGGARGGSGHGGSAHH
jgi:hypothetical protein